MGEASVDSVLEIPKGICRWLFALACVSIGLNTKSEKRLSLGAEFLNSGLTFLKISKKKPKPTPYQNPVRLVTELSPYSLGIKRFSICFRIRLIS
jgi:hypothetical protein